MSLLENYSNQDSFWLCLFTPAEFCQQQEAGIHLACNSTWEPLLAFSWKKMLETAQWLRASIALGGKKCFKGWCWGGGEGWTLADICCGYPCGLIFLLLWWTSWQNHLRVYFVSSFRVCPSWKERHSCPGLGADAHTAPAAGSRERWMVMLGLLSPLCLT